MCDFMRELQNFHITLISNYNQKLILKLQTKKSATIKASFWFHSFEMYDILS